MHAEILNKLDQLLALQYQLLSLCKSLREPLPPEEWLDNADVKRLLKISDSSLYRLRKNNILPAKQIAGKWYYKLAVLHELIAVK